MLRSFMVGALLALTPFLASAQTPRLDTKAEIGITDNVFLRNYMGFSGDRYTGGASSSFVEIDGVVYLVTAKHLLTDAMGLEPEVKPSKFDEELEGWIALTNTDFNDLENAEPLANVTGIVRPDDNFDDDFMILETDGDSVALRNRILPISKTVATKGDRVHIIGCPYSMEDRCQQIIYTGEVTETDSGLFLFTWGPEPPDQLSGFSGGAVLNDRGELVGVIYGGDLEAGLATAIPVWLMQFGGS